MHLRIKKGLKKIPSYIQEQLSEETLKDLHTVGYGLSFPSHWSCQVRIKRNGITYGAHFNYSEYDNINQTVRMAIKYSRKLLQDLAAEQIIPVIGKGYRGIRFEKIYDKRRDRYEYQHVVSYVNPVTGRRRTKVFWHGVKEPTPGQWLHAQHTALFFKWEQEFIAEVHGTCIRHEMFDGWKNKRLYHADHPNVEYDKL